MNWGYDRFFPNETTTDCQPPSAGRYERAAIPELGLEPVPHTIFHSRKGSIATPHPVRCAERLALNTAALTDLHLYANFMCR